MLGRAKTLMRGWVAPSAVAAMPYNVACANGHRLRGERTEGYQALRCPSCGEAVFILPRSPLPEPPVPTASKRTRSQQDIAASYPSDDAPHALVDPPVWAGSQPPLPPAAPAHGTDDGAEIEWEEEAPKPARPTVVKPEAKAPGTPQAGSRPTPGARPAPPRPAPMVAPPVVTLAPRLSWREWTLAHRNPLLAASLVLLITGAILIKQWRQRLESLPRIAEAGRTEGIKKLDAGEFFAAKMLLAPAAAAVDALGGRFEGAAAIRQAAREVAILTDLVPRSLEDLVEEAETFSDVTGWSKHFDSMYRGRSILLETTITAVPDPDKPGSRYEDAYRILVGRGSTPKAKGRIDYAGFVLFELAKPKLDETHIVGARLAALEFNSAENTWFLALEPDSGVFVTHTQALEALHWPVGEPSEEPAP